VNYRVRWRKLARNQLAEIWLASTDRNAVSAAAHHVDQMLARDPMACSESRDRGRRVVFVGPLTVFFRIIEDDKKVLFVNVRAKK
jgi:plasmid stabilization system protein ParE